MPEQKTTEQATAEAPGQATAEQAAAEAPGQAAQKAPGQAAQRAPGQATREAPGQAAQKAPGQKAHRKQAQLAASSVVSRPRKVMVVIVLIVLLVACFVLSLALVGRYDVDFGALANQFLAFITGQGEETADLNVLFTIRAPRVIAAVLVGAALAGAGCAFQGTFKNPMVSPDLLGASSGACFGASLGILLSLGGVGVEIAAFVTGIVAVAISYALSVSVGRRVGGILVLVLCGIVVSNLFEAFTSAVKFLADPNSQLPEITFWLMGGLSSVHTSDLLPLVIMFLIGTVGLVVMRWRLNIMALGEEEAMTLGVDVRRSRLLVVCFATILTASSVAVAGMVGWVGLIVPHLARFLVGPDHRTLLPASMLLGGSFLLIVDDVCRSIYTTEIPLSILTAIIGAPLFIYLIVRRGRN